MKLEQEVARALRQGDVLLELGPHYYPNILSTLLHHLLPECFPSFGIQLGVRKRG